MVLILVLLLTFLSIGLFVRQYSILARLLLTVAIVGMLLLLYLI